MTPTPPKYVLESIERAGKAFYKHLDALNWPDANRDAPAKEANIVLHVARELMQEKPAFHVYLEAATFGRGRMDLLAAGNEIAIALEAKCFGNIGEQAEALSDDVNRLKEFNPRYAKLDGGSGAEDWWKNAQSRWGIAVAASFRHQDEVAKAWRLRDSAHLLDDKDRPGFDMLLDSLKGAYLDAFFIDPGNRWESCGHVYLLIAAFEI